MFEKEAEEIANKRCHEIMCYGHCSFSSPKHHRCGEWHREYECALKGAELGYNKGKEWHYVKDGDLPKDDENFICMLENGYRLECFYDPTTKRWYDNFFRHDIEYGYYQSKVVAWKEIILPELKELE